MRREHQRAGVYQINVRACMRDNPKKFIEEYGDLTLNDAQSQMIDNIANSDTIHIQRRPVRRYGLTVKWLDTFNKICKDGKESIEWHAPNWVAMSRNQYDKLVAAANKNNIKIIYNEYEGDE